jgi:hypothetical protein
LNKVFGWFFADELRTHKHIKKDENLSNSTHLGFFDNLDDLDGVFDADFGAIVSCNR